jgi:hypothetical protein
MLILFKSLAIKAGDFLFIPLLFVILNPVKKKDELYGN